MKSFRVPFVPMRPGAYRAPSLRVPADAAYVAAPGRLDGSGVGRYAGTLAEAQPLPWTAWPLGRETLRTSLASALVRSEVLR